MIEQGIEPCILRVDGFEALIRWPQPDGTFLSPAEFVPLAEMSGLIVPIGRWVIDQATHDAAGWQASSGLPLSIAVNLSPRQLHDPELVQCTAEALANAGLAPETLIIEITENLLLKDTELARARLAELRALGVKVAVDDFGTGYSSLAYLDQYPVDILKIDRSFVDPLGGNARSAALVRSIIDMASALDIDAIAEGVEDAGQLATLQSLGCRLAQGFFFARPRPAVDIAGLLAADSIAEELPAQRHAGVVKPTA